MCGERDGLWILWKTLDLPFYFDPFIFDLDGGWVFLSHAL